MGLAYNLGFPFSKCVVMSIPAISIKNARKTYANGFTALQEVSFDVQQGEFFALLGPNGAGKTTLISAMAGLGRLTSGSIEVMGHDVVKDAYKARMNLGVVPQELVFDPFFTVREALKFQSGYFGIKKNDDWIDEILFKLGLADKANTNTRMLSGGMKRRVMVAQALVHKPPVIVLDEPTAGVDVELRQNLWQFVSELNEAGHSIVLTTHYLEEAEALCSRIAMMKRGQLVALDDKEHLLRGDVGAAKRIWLKIDQAKLPPEVEALCVAEDQDGFILELPTWAGLEEVLAALRQANINVVDMDNYETDLEDVFLRLVEEPKKEAQ